MTLKVDARLGVAVKALRLIAPQRKCESFTTGIGSCFRAGRTIDAEYSADRCCDSCIAHDALDRIAGRGAIAQVEGSAVMPKSQCGEILAYLQTGLSLSPLEALEKFGCFRLGGRIYDLRKQGHKIETVMVGKNGKRFASYSLRREDDSGEGPTGCMDDGDDLSLALRGMSHEDLNRILKQELS